ncbi:uncharacterized protein [Cardiocondyla obscurior]|uniref:uncharacterized protein isoform X3 n=1 Tax=Cardiocondyla obscurior TaxID=286306 RepID=UPI00396565CD
MTHVKNNQQDILKDIFIKRDSKNFDENGFVMTFKDLFQTNFRDKFPNNFDKWTVKQQCSWLIDNIAVFFPNTPQSLLSFIPGSYCQLDYNNRSIEELPNWMDIDKYRKGQQFWHKNYAAILISKLIGLTYVYTFDDELKPIIIGGNEHTPYLAFRRYMSTIKRMSNWYEGEPWIKGTDAYKDMRVTRSMHLQIRQKLCGMSHEQIAAKCTLANPWNPDRELLLKDFSAACPPEKHGQRPQQISQKSSYRPKGLNNSDFAMTQYLFVVFPLLYPHSIGIHDATDDDLEAFCHVWKCYGYFLGIDDEYNFCRGTLDEIKQRANDIYHYWIRQNFKEITPEWEHITRCFIICLNYVPLVYLPYKVGILILTNILNINMPHLYASLNYAEWMTYKFYKFMFYGMKFSSVRKTVNKIVRHVFYQAYNFGEKELEIIHKKSNKLLPDFSL